MKRRLKRDEKNIFRYEFTHFDKIILALIGFVGLIVFWKGFATLMERVFPQTEPFTFMAAGIVLMLLTGWFIKK